MPKKPRLHGPDRTEIACNIETLTQLIPPDARNPRKHSREQIRAIAQSIESFGFNAPILADATGKVLAGHGRLEAAKLLGEAEIPVILLENLSNGQAHAYMLADNKLTDRSTWDQSLLAKFGR